MIKIGGLYKSFGSNDIFHDFNLNIGKGEFVIFSGPSGCGKTTLLNMIGGLEPIDRGKIIVDHVDVGKTKNKLGFFRHTIGFLFQNFALVENKTVRQNLEFVHSKGRSNLTMEGALDSVGMKDALDKKVYTLSGGEQQRVALARLRMKDCSIILADEPTGSLDSGNGMIIMKILHEMNQSGKTILMVTHDESLMNQGTRLIELDVL